MQRKAHQRASLFGEKSNLRLCLASHARILSHVSDAELNSDPVYWVRVLKDELHSVPFLTTLGGKSA